MKEKLTNRLIPVFAKEVVGNMRKSHQALMSVEVDKDVMICSFQIDFLYRCGHIQVKIRGHIRWFMALH